MMRFSKIHPDRERNEAVWREKERCARRIYGITISFILLLSTQKKQITSAFTKIALRFLENYFVEISSTGVYGVNEFIFFLTYEFIFNYGKSK